MAANPLPTGPHPPVISKPVGATNPPGVFGYGINEAAYVVGLGRFQRPRIINPNGSDFVFPLGTEGFSIRGSAELAHHKYIGDNAAVIEVTHMDDRTIAMSGILPGKTAATNMVALLDVLTAKTPDKGKILVLPDVFGSQQKVVVEDYEFNRDETDRTGSIAYSITFVRTGVGKKIKKPGKTSPPSNPKRNKKNKGKKSHRTFVVKENFRTLRAISKKVYGNADKWKKIYNMNKYALQVDARGQVIPANKIPTALLPLGLTLNV